MEDTSLTVDKNYEDIAKGSLEEFNNIVGHFSCLRKYSNIFTKLVKKSGQERTF